MMHPQFEAMFNALRSDVQQSIGGAYSQIRDLKAQLDSGSRMERILAQIGQQQAMQQQQISDLLSKIAVGGGGGGGGERSQQFLREQRVLYINDIPGQRIPKDILVAIPIGANITGRQTGTFQIPNDGPFVATSRFMAFRSDYTFSVTNPDSGAVATFNGRSFGRWRPVHSVMDWADNTAWNPTSGKADPGDGTAIYASPTNHSSFRSMQFDGVIEFQDSGSQVPRQNLPVPSAWYISSANEHFSLGALDFFERNTSITWYVTPNHVNNPGTGAGNVFGFDGTNPIFPSADSQYDVPEGVLDPAVVGPTADPASRNPAGTLYIGFHGFQIRVPPGVTPML